VLHGKEIVAFVGCAGCSFSEQEQQPLLTVNIRHYGCVHILFLSCFLAEIFVTVCF